MVSSVRTPRTHFFVRGQGGRCEFGGFPDWIAAVYGIVKQSEGHIDDQECGNVPEKPIGELKNGEAVMQFVEQLCLKPPPLFRAVWLIHL